MTKTRLQIFALAVVLSAVGGVSGVARSAPDTTLADISGYRGWTRVTGKPVEVPITVEVGNLALPAV